MQLENFSKNINNVIDIAGDIFKRYNDYSYHPAPAFKIIVDGVDISSVINSRLINMTLTDNRGLIVDTVDIELDDSDALLNMPPKGASVEVWIGWNNKSLVNKGKFKVTSVSHRGTPDRISISAQSSDLSAGLKQKRERNFTKKTINDIFQAIGIEYDLKTVVHEKFVNKVISYIAQNESDANLITRIADEQDAIATVKNGHLILLPRGSSQTVSGLPLPRFDITRGDGDGHDYTDGTGSEQVTSVKAFYYNANKSEKLFVIIGDNKDNPKEIRHVHRDKQTAEFAANAEYNQLKRSAQKLTYNFAYGIPDLIPEQEMTFIGLKPQIDDIIWLGTNVQHRISEAGYTSSVELEVQLPNADDVSTLFEANEDKEKKGNSRKRTGKNYADYTGVIAYYRGTGKDAVITVGDQSKPLKLTHVYKSKKTATNAVNREYARIKKINPSKN